jgi:CheY-like chemotaxis protein
LNGAQGWPPLSRGSRALLPYLILLLGLCFTILAYYYFSKLTYEQDHSRFKNATQEIQDKVRLRLQTSIALLRAGTGLFAASERVDTGEFDRFVQQIELPKNYPGIQGIGFSHGFRPEKEAEAVRREAMEKARDTGLPGEAIQAIREHRPDVLVSDIAMPGEDGYGLIAKVRSLENQDAQNIPAVAITAYAKDEDRKRALSSGFQIYLAKPIELTELVSVVARAARRDF